MSVQAVKCILMSCWCIHYRLYKSVGEYDVVNAVLSNYVTTHEVTLQAIDAEVRSDYTLAAKLYNQVTYDLHQLLIMLILKA